jgi:protein-L-isoaspartate(D-aspartate) O-methyltransferase
MGFMLAFASMNETENKEHEFAEKRKDMVDFQLLSRGISDKKTIEAMRKVPRHKFVPEYLRDMAYSDTPLPIGMGQTISQPYIVAYMTELLSPKKGQKILEVGTGSGYQAAVLSEIGCEVYTIEIVEPLAVYARSILSGLGYMDIHFKIGDGYLGWESHAPYDGIVVTAASPEVPEPLTSQLKAGGRLIIPVGEDLQELLLVTKTKEGLREEKISPVRFVPMTGEAEKHHRR